MATAYPTVYAAVLSTATTALTGMVRVVDGFDLSSEPGDVVLIGVPNLGEEESIAAGSFSQDPSTFGRAPGTRKETGTVNGCVLAQNGQGEAANARTTAFSYIDALADALRNDPSIGVTAFSLVAQLTSGDISEDQVDGATCAVSFTVTYTAFV